VILVAHMSWPVVNFRLPLIRDLVANGCSVEVLSPDWPGEQLEILRSAGARGLTFPLQRTDINPLWDIRTLWHLYRHFRNSKPQVVFSFGAKTNVWGMVAARMARVPRRVAMVEGMGYAFTDSPGGGVNRGLLRWILRMLYRLAFASAHRVVLLNQDDLRDLTNLCGLDESKAYLLGPIGIPLEEWPMREPHLNPITFTMVGRILREKGVMEYLEAARIVKSHHPEVRFNLLGPLFDNPGALSAMDIKPYVEDGTVCWPGMVDVKPWLERTSVFVLPSYREGVPRSTQEAMAMGRPVITTDSVGCRDTVEDRVNGFLVPPRDVAALAEAMERFVMEPELIVRMGLESRRMAEERFDMRSANRRIMEVMGV